MSWDPQQYSRFAGQRLRPVLDLIARIPIGHPQAYPRQPDGKTLFPFRRRFIVAVP